MKKYNYNYDQPFDISFQIRGLGSTQMDGEPFVTTASIFRDKVENYLFELKKKGVIKSFTISVSVDELKEARETIERNR